MRSTLRTLVLIAGFSALPWRAEAGDSALLSIEAGACREADFAEPLLEACDRAFAAGRCQLGEPNAPPKLRAKLERLDDQRVRVIVVGTDGTDRHAELTFAAADSWSERAKAVGLAVGALASSTIRTETSTSTVPDGATNVPPTNAPSTANASITDARPTPPAASVTDAPAPARNRYLLLVQGDMASDPSLDHLEAGAGLRGWVKFPSAPLTWRAGFDALAGHDGANTFGSTRLQPTLGVGNEWRTQRWALDLGFDGGIEWQNASSATNAQSRITPLVRVQVSALFDVVERFGLSVSAQSTVTFSPTDVYVDGVERAHGSGYQWGLAVGIYRRFGE